MVKISGSILPGINNINDIVNDYNNLHIDYIHLDVMDGKFVSNTAFNIDDINNVVSLSNKKLDVHLMVEDPNKYIDVFNASNTSYLTIHYEVIKDIDILLKIKKMGIKCGISIKPNTNVEDIYFLLPYVDLVLIMSVEPGMGGQKFIDNSLNKINKLYNEIGNKGLNTVISVDGGINEYTSKLCINNGANMLVIGSALYNSNDKNNLIKNIINS